MNGRSASRRTSQGIRYQHTKEEWETSAKRTEDWYDRIHAGVVVRGRVAPTQEKCERAATFEEGTEMSQMNGAGAATGDEPKRRRSGKEKELGESMGENISRKVGRGSLE